MPYLNNLPELSRSRRVVDSFYGLNRNPRPEEGEFAALEGFTDEEFPLLVSRRPAGLVQSLTRFQGLLGGEQLALAENGTLYYAGSATALTNLSAGRKQLLRFGAYVLVFPDKLYWNTENPQDWGSMEARWASPGSSCQISYRACLSDGTVLENRAVSALPPEDPAQGDLWYCETDGGCREYREESGGWTLMETVYVKIGFPTDGQLTAFREGDGVQVSGAAFESMNGTKILQAVGTDPETGGDYIVIIGDPGADYTDPAGHVEIARAVPELDYVCECQNRLWGCYYGVGEDGSALNELYASALGDFKNWRRYQGISTDSWTASVGEGGVWTGAVNYLGCPTFFKEDSVHRVIVSPNGAHQVTETPCRGIQRGSEGSLQLVGETLYYKSRADVCAWQGGFPVSVSEKLGGELYKNAAAGVCGSTLYLCMQGEDGVYRLFCYDTLRRLWTVHSRCRVTAFAPVGSELYAAAESESGTVLLALRGTSGETEAAVTWLAETGMLTFRLPERKYPAELEIRLQPGTGCSCELLAEYDSCGVWESCGSVTVRPAAAVSGAAGTALIPLHLRRCDHLRLRLQGSGPVKVFSAAAVYERGGED